MTEASNAWSGIEPPLEEATLSLFCYFRQVPSIPRKAIRTVILKAVETETDHRLVLQVPLSPGTQTFRHVRTGQNPTADPEKATNEVCILFVEIASTTNQLKKKGYLSFDKNSLQYGRRIKKLNVVQWWSWTTKHDEVQNWTWRSESCFLSLNHTMQSKRKHQHTSTYLYFEPLTVSRKKMLRLGVKWNLLAQFPGLFPLFGFFNYTSLNCGHWWLF